MSYFELQFNRWSGTDPKGNPCKSSQVIDAAIDSSSIGIAMVNTYFDFDDYSSPIKTYKFKRTNRSYWYVIYLATLRLHNRNLLIKWVI